MCAPISLWAQGGAFSLVVKRPSHCRQQVVCDSREMSKKPQHLTLTSYSPVTFGGQFFLESNFQSASAGLVREVGNSLMVCGSVGYGLFRQSDVTVEPLNQALRLSLYYVQPHIRVSAT